MVSDMRFALLVFSFLSIFMALDERSRHGERS